MPVRRGRLCDTFSSLEELRTARELQGEEIDPGLLQLFMDAAAERVVLGFNRVKSARNRADAVVWNYMVKRHDLKVARRMAFKQSAKKKALNSFDAFLSLIMK